MNEAIRLQRLRRLAILDTAAEPLFDSFARLAARIAARPVAFIGFADESRVWCKAATGLEPGTEFPRAGAFCDHALHGEGIFEVADAQDDPRFAGHPLIGAGPCLRSYAGVPLVMPGGARVGVLAVAAQRPGTLDMFQRAQLEELASSVVHALAARERGHGQEARAAADTANRLKSDFLATVSHEIRTPLNGVLGLARLLLKEQLRPQQAEYGRLILGSAESLLALIDDVLDYSKIEAGRLSVEDCAFDLRALLGELHRIHHLRASEKSLFFTTDIAEDVPGWVMADSTRLRQILNNLLGNALKFTQYGSVALGVRRNAGPAGETLEIAVSDTGIGIAPDQQALLFNRFSQADASTTRRFGGTGLGLAIARQLARLMGGEITLQSQMGAGSVFSVRLPLRPTQPAAVEAAPPAAQQDGIDARILVVEDNATNQVVAKGLLWHLGYRSVTVANDGMEALRCWSEGRFDLILMDCQMPVMDGFQATRELRRRGCAVPIVALTANAVQGDRNRCLASGMDDYLTKPIDPVALEAMMCRLVAREVAKMMPVPPPAPVKQAAADAPQVFDLEGTLGRFMDDRELLCAAASACIRQAEELLVKLEAALMGGDAKSASAIAHSLKGSTATVGATTVARLAREIEAAVAGGDTKEAACALPALHLALEHFRHVACEELELSPLALA